MAPTGSQQRPLAGRSAWIITTGLAGMDVQTRGVADALGLRYEMKRVAPQGIFKLLAPWGPVAPAERFGEAGSQFAPPWPDVAISLGRSCVPYMRALRRRSPATFSVVMLDNRAGLGVADVIWVPQHDRLRGANVITTLTAPHSFTAARLAALRATVPARDRRAAAPAYRRHPWRQEQGLRVPRGGRRAFRRRTQVARRAGGELHDHAVAPDARALARRDRRSNASLSRAFCGTARAPTPTATSSLTPTR